DRLRVGSIGLAALYVRLDVSRWHQPNLMSRLRQLARPVMRRAARLHAHQARRQLGEERQHLRSPERLANNRLTSRVDSMNLKMLLAKSRPIVVISMWVAPSRGRFDSNHTLALRCREREPSTPSALRRRTGSPERPRSSAALRPD